MKRIAIVICYFGKLPNYFNLWLNSCKYNQTIDFLLFTDDQKEYDYPKNVKVHYVSFNEIKSRIQEKFEFKIKLNDPYKLCDYRPTYGLIFEKELKEYDFWGHCDLDTIWGDLRKYLNEDILNNYDKIYKYGHFSLYKNCEIINNNFKELLDTNNNPKYKKVFQSDKSFFFDETAGIVKVYDDNKYKMYANRKVIADISIKYNNLIPMSWKENKNYIFQKYIENDVCKLCGYYLEKGKVKKQEFMYIHLQKRKMDNLVSNANDFYIFPNKFIDTNYVDDNIIYRYLHKIVLLRKEYIKYRLNNFYRNMQERKNNE